MPRGEPWGARPTPFSEKYCDNFKKVVVKKSISIAGYCATLDH